LEVLENRDLFSVNPLVESINLANPTGPLTNASSVNYTVTFNEPVTGVATTAFQLAETGGVTGVVSQVTPVSGSVYTVTVSNITGNGTLGLNLVDNGSIRDLAGHNLVGTLSFEKSQSIPIGASLTCAPVVADLNGDGKPDLVLSERTGVTYSVEVLLNNGDGTFRNGQTIATAVGPSSVTVGDVTGDGKPALIFGYGGGGVGVHLGNGDGTFQNPVVYAAGEVEASRVALADVNGDGKPDIIAAGYGSVSVLLGNGNGTFQNPQTTNLGPGVIPVSMAVADLNNDGKLDIVLAEDNKLSASSSDITVLLGKGDGTFQTPENLTAGPGLNNGGRSYSAYSVAVADVNGDGYPDITVATTSLLLADPGETGHGISVLLGNGDGTFQAQKLSPLQNDSVLAVANMNGEGKPDIVISRSDNYGSVGVLVGNGDGTFQGPQAFAPGTTGGFIEVTDINGDGKPDIVTEDSNNNVNILLNTTNGNFTGQVYTIDQTPPVVQSIRLQGLSSTISNANSVNFTITFSKPVTGVDATDFQPVATGTVATALTQVTPVSGSVYTVTVSGITGNGTLGLNVVNNSNIRDLAGNSFAQGNSTPASFLGPQIYSIGNEPAVGYPTYGVEVADVNGDGIRDILTLNYNPLGGQVVYVLLGNGDGTFQSAQNTGVINFYAGGTYAPVAVADLNGDGKPDMVTVGADGTVNVYLGAAPNYTILNSTPTAHITADPNATQAPDKANLLLTATDTLSQALAPGFTYTINWNDGTNPQTIGATVNNGSGVSVNHTYAADGSYLVSVTATDTNGAISTAATGLVVASSKTGDSVAESGGSSAGQVAVSVDGASAATFSPTDLVLVSGQGGNDVFTVNFGSTLTTPITFAGSGSDTLNANGSTDSTLSNYIVKNGSAQTVTWGTTANQSTDSVGYSGIQNVNVFGGAGPNYITDPGTNTTIYGGPGANTIVITATTGNGVTIHGGGSDTYVVDLGNLAGPVSIQNSNAGATDNLIVNGATGNNTIAAAGNQITEGTQTITDTAALANLTVNGGSGNNQLTVSSLTVPVQSVTLAGGGGTNTYNVSAGTVNIVAGTGVNVLNATGGTVASITAPVGDTKPLVFAHSYTVLANGTLSVPASGVLANDVSANGQSLTAVLATGPAHGTLTLNANGSFVYTPSSNFVGVDTFTYQAKGSDGTLSVPATVTIQVTYKFSGFLPPLSQGLTYAVNRTIPIKFQLADANGKAITSLSAVTSLQIVPIVNGVPGSPFNPASTNNQGLQYSGGQYLFNWQTKGLAAGSYQIMLKLADGTTQTKTIQLTAGGSSAGLVTDGSGGTATAGALLGGEVDLYVDNSSSDLTSDELARIQDAVNTIDATIAPYGVVINQVSDPTQANVTLNMNTTSALGGLAQGVLGCTTDADQVTMIQGWNWYAGSDATQIGSGQYDFETAVMHELGQCWAWATAATRHR
jgi:hypothetical protein